MVISRRSAPDVEQIPYLPIQVNRLDLRVKLDHPLAHLAEHTRAAVLEPAKWRLHRRAACPLIHYQHPRFGLLHKTNRFLQIVGEH